jgi:two-component system chemotaxis response regulator CheB
LSSLSASFTTNIFIVQHLASGLANSVAESLCRRPDCDVREADFVQPLDAAAVWLAPCGRLVVVTRRRTTVQVAPNSDPLENDCLPSVDVVFRYVDEIVCPSGFAVGLTGTGYDRLARSRSLRQAGGRLLVQNQVSSVARGMPGQFATAGPADLVLPLSDLSAQICRHTAGTGTRR